MQRSRGGNGPGCLVWNQGGQSGDQDIDLGGVLDGGSGGTYSRGEEEWSDSGNTLKMDPAGFTVNWMWSVRGRLALCRTANPSCA